jgi:cell division protease FtsH
VHKVSIIARGRALGWTLSLPTEDRNIVSRKAMKAQLAMALGGRVAEEVVFGEPTTGAANDIEKVSSMARAMVTQYGMSDELGPQKLGAGGEESYLGRGASQANYSGEVGAKIDEEIRRLVDEAHQTATAIVTTHRETLDKLAETLIEKETADTDDLTAVWGHLPMWTGDANQPA